MGYILNRLREPSTWAGVAAILGAVRINIDPGLWATLSTTGMAMAGLGAALAGDRPA